MSVACFHVVDLSGLRAMGPRCRHPYARELFSVSHRRPHWCRTTHTSNAGRTTVSPLLPLSISPALLPFITAVDTSDVGAAALTADTIHSPLLYRGDFVPQLSSRSRVRARPPHRSRLPYFRRTLSPASYAFLTERRKSRPGTFISPVRRSLPRARAPPTATPISRRGRVVLPTSRASSSQPCAQRSERSSRRHRTADANGPALAHLRFGHYFSGTQLLVPTTTAGGDGCGPSSRSSVMRVPT